MENNGGFVEFVVTGYPMICMKCGKYCGCSLDASEIVMCHECAMVLENMVEFIATHHKTNFEGEGYVKKSCN